MTEDVFAFPTRFRGYDRDAVDQELHELRTALDYAQAERDRAVARALALETNDPTSSQTSATVQWLIDTAEQDAQRIRAEAQQAGAEYMERAEELLRHRVELIEQAQHEADACRAQASQEARVVIHDALEKANTLLRGLLESEAALQEMFDSGALGHRMPPPRHPADEAQPAMAAAAPATVGAHAQQQQAAMRQATVQQQSAAPQQAGTQHSATQQPTGQQVAAQQQAATQQASGQQALAQQAAAQAVPRQAEAHHTGTQHGGAEQATHHSGAQYTAHGGVRAGTAEQAARHGGTQYGTAEQAAGAVQYSAEQTARHSGAQYADAAHSGARAGAAEQATRHGEAQYATADQATYGTRHSGAQDTAGQAARLARQGAAEPDMRQTTQDQAVHQAAADAAARHAHQIPGQQTAAPQPTTSYQATPDQQQR